MRKFRTCFWSVHGWRPRSYLSPRESRSAETSFNICDAEVDDGPTDAASCWRSPRTSRGPETSSDDPEGTEDFRRSARAVSSLAAVRIGRELNAGDM